MQPVKPLTTLHPASLRHAALAAILLASLATSIRAQQPGQKKYLNAEAAAEALLKAAQANDEKAILGILGTAGRRLVASGDAAEDAEARASFVKNYLEMHRLVKEPDGTTTLYIGAENWPTPIPLRDRDDAWFFDTKAGEHEILVRRIGRNETSTIRVCQELVLAQKDFRASHHDTFAKRMHSEGGKHDGLYWPAAADEPRSPIGPLVASAATGGAKGAPTPYRGYLYRLVPGQANGFTFVAYPAEYRSSGVMTFRVDQDGVVYEKDLGRKTPLQARILRQSSPLASWTKTDEPPE